MLGLLGNRFRRFRNIPEILFENTGGVSTGRYGNAIALSGDGKVLAIGAPFDNSNRGLFQVFHRQTDGTWFSYDGKLSSGLINAYEGYSVALNYDGSVLSVGAPAITGLRAPFISNFLFSPGNGYNLTQTLNGPTDSDGSTITNFGESIALSHNGNYAVVGAPLWRTGSGAGNANTGVGRVYTVAANGVFTFITNLITSGANSYYGRRVGINEAGTRIILGSEGYNNYAGGVAVWDYNGSSWSRTTTLSPTVAGNSYTTGGCAISSDGNTIVAATADDGNLPINSFFYLHKYNGSSWDTSSKYTSNWGTIASCSTNYSGNLVAVSGIYTTDEKVKIFKNLNNVATAINPEIIKNGGSNNQGFGFSTVMSSNGRTLAVGRPFYNSNSGQVVLKYRR
jgi:hypothetical protein